MFRPENGSYKLIARVQMEEWPQSSQRRSERPLGLLNCVAAVASQLAARRERTLVDPIGMSALGQKRTFTATVECPLSANSGHRHSFDHFVSNLLDMDGHLKSERFGSLEINQ